MAITLNKKTVPDIVTNAYGSGLITAESSSTVAVYQISSYWRELFQTATRHRSEALPQWNEKEVAAAKVITSALLFLAMEGCRNVEQLIEAIQHESEHMKYLVEQLLFLARGDSGKTKLTLEEISLSHLMEEIYEESLMIDEKHPYRYRKPQEEIVVQADGTLLKQAVRILTDNSAKYTHEGDEIVFSLGKTREGIPYLQVQDTGIGMEEIPKGNRFILWP